ncbi:unnamed protein product [Brassica oleracea var. botrytis]|uniref:COBRA C-terminal domain-containing protein n=2 Tax=Brassica TaxID=3705 RepID=A0A3P6FNU1_BRAOL|nr:unnamed protein product [Brassica napus]VDD49404.1 unnamed protein product [Brassica oleracea]
MPIPKKLPCPDNCGVSINWHVNTDYRDGWTARLTVFNWRDFAFEDWFVALRWEKQVQGMKTSTPLMAHVFHQTTEPLYPPVPGKQQSVISFKKKNIKGLNIPEGDGFPTKLFFNGEECALPKHFPKKSSGQRHGISVLMSLVLAMAAAFALMMD